MLDRDEIMKLWAEVKANHKRLEECHGPHNFIVTTKPDDPSRRYRCSRCQGEVDNNSRHWYALGLEHGTRLGLERR